MDNSNPSDRKARFGIAALRHGLLPQRRSEIGRFRVRLVLDHRRGADGGILPSRHLENACDRLQDAVVELEDLLFKSAEIRPDCRADVHEAIGCIMESLNRLALAHGHLDAGGVPLGGRHRAGLGLTSRLAPQGLM